MPKTFWQPPKPEADGVIETLDRQQRNLLLSYTELAFAVLRREAFDYRSPPQARIRAAKLLLDAASRTAAIKDCKVQVAELESLDPGKEARKRLTLEELETLGDFIDNRDAGLEITPEEIRVAQKYANIEQEIRTMKNHRLSERRSR